MPSGQHVEQERPLHYRHPADKSSILQSVKEQEVRFEHLSQELEVERQTLANQLEKYKHRDHETLGSSFTGVEDPYHWRPTNLNATIPEDAELDSTMTDSHLHYYPEHGSNIHDYIQESEPQVQESYSVTYRSSTSTNGHHGDGDVSPNPSHISLPVDNASLISRSTSQTKTQQVKTVTKVITTREVHHIGPDGQPITYPPYGAATPPVSSNDYVTYSYNSPADMPRDYNTYETAHPPTTLDQPTSQSYSRDYGTYGRTTSPGAGRTYDRFPPQGGQGYADFGYQEFPSQTATPPSVASESPPPHRAVPQTPRSGLPEYNHQPSNYEELDSALAPPRIDYHRRTPSPGQGSDRFGPYGYTGHPLPVSSPGYHPYEAPPPQGYLDRRPSYDDHPPQTQAQHAQHPPTYARPPRVGYDGEEGIPPHPEGQFPIPPRHPHLEYNPADGEGTDVRWRDPDLHEVIEFLGHPNNVVRANAAAYLQHLCYMDDNMKQKSRSLGGIPPLIELLNQDIPEIQRNACGALRNLSYGRQNDENKRAIRNAGGIPALVRLLRKTPDNEVRELVTGVLWNLSSCEDLKRPIIDDALTVLVNHVIIPHSGWDRNQDPSEPVKTQDIYWSTVFRNASGVLRNVSSAGEYARKKLRECEGLVDATLYLVRAAIGKNDMDNKMVENCVCVLRNLSYRCQEVEDTEYDKHIHPLPQSRASAPIKAVGDNLGCFGASKKKKELQTADKLKREGIPLTKNPIGQSEPTSGMSLLWQAEVVQPYLALLSECSNPETLEAAAGAIQNLAACYWQPSIDIRAAVRKEKGLPILVELLRMEVDRVVCAVSTALRNLAMDQRNKELIGKYAMRDLVQKLPNGNPQHDGGVSDDTIAAVLATLNEVIVKNSDFARLLLVERGVDRLTYITKQKEKFSLRVVKFTSQLLYNMWQHQELREVYKKAGWKESSFVTKPLVTRNATSPTASANNTLSRPISSQGGTKYEDRTIPRARELNSVPPGSIPYSRSEELPLSDLSQSAEPPPQSQSHRPPVGAIPIFPPGLLRSPNEPVYAHVNREKKKSGLPEPPLHVPEMASLLDDRGGGSPARDSWV